MAKLFLYGTLMVGLPNHPYVRRATLLDSTTVTRDKFSLYSDSLLPFMTREPRVNVVGQLFEVNLTLLRVIDDLEGHPVWYRREVICVTTSSGREESAWAYLMRLENVPSTALLIEEGNYRVYLHRVLSQHEPERGISSAEKRRMS